jgi:hypothetical protein
MKAKKKLNIPICDVLIDPDYEAIIKADYVQPQNYVRHTKKIGNEPDMTVDYNIEEEDLRWIRSNPRFVNEEEIAQYLGEQSFEALMDILERVTSHSKEPVKQARRG